MPDPNPVAHTPWHALEPGEVLARLPEPGPVEVPADDERSPSAVRSALRTAAALVNNVRAELADPLADRDRDNRQQRERRCAEAGPDRVAKILADRVDH